MQQMLIPYRKVLVLALYACLLMAICSTCSFLYPVNLWVDVDSFMTVGRGILSGLAPYRDLVDQKGPWLYGVCAALALVPGNGYLGMWICEAAANAATLIIAWKLVEALGARPTLWTLMALDLSFALSSAFLLGGSAEELCVPLLMYALLTAVRYFQGGARHMSRGALVANGFLAGVIFLTKFTLIGLHFAFMAVIAVDAVIRDRRLGRAVGMCGLFLAGMALAFLPCAVYLGLFGALGDCVRVYFIDNLFSYADERSIGIMLGNMRRSVLENPALFATVALGVATTLLRRRSLPLAGRVCVFAMAACLTLSVYIGCVCYQYYFAIFFVFSPLMLPPICVWEARLRKRLGNRIWPGAVLTSAAAILCLGLALLKGPNADQMRVPYEETPQGAFSAVVLESENPSLLCVGAMDIGLYQATDQTPPFRLFCAMNIRGQENFAAQMAYVRTGNVGFLVCGDHTLNEYCQRYGVDGEIPYALRLKMDFAAYGQTHTYYLYERREEAEA